MISNGSFSFMLFLEQYTSQMTSTRLYIKMLFFIFLIKIYTNNQIFQFRGFPGYCPFVREEGIDQSGAGLVEDRI